jgi:hypothetical protein
MIEEEIDFNNNDILQSKVSILEGKVADIETLLGVDGANFVKSIISGAYPETISVVAGDKFYMEGKTGEKFHIDFQTILDAVNGQRFRGTYEN